MSDEARDLFHHEPFRRDDDRSGFQFSQPHQNHYPSMYYNQSFQGVLESSSQDLHGSDPPPFMSFTDCLHGSVDDYNSLARTFDFSCSSPDVFGSDNTSALQLGGQRDSMVTGDISVTANSSVSSSSSEAAGEEDSSKSKKEQQPKGSEEGKASEKSKKV